MHTHTQCETRKKVTAVLENKCACVLLKILDDITHCTTGIPQSDICQSKTLFLEGGH